jgi:hypothetical protein
MADLGDFLAHSVEGYLFGDLKAMQAVSQAEGARGGGLGYPMLMTTLAGIELLGALLIEQPFDAHAGKKYFQAYWKSYLYPNDPPKAAAADIAYALARHAIAHTFLLKGRLAVVKGRPTVHLALGSSGEFYIDATQLALDFIDSYDSRIKPSLDNPSGRVNSVTMGQRLSELELSYANAAASTTAAIAATSLTTVPTMAEGSDPFGRISSSVSTNSTILMSPPFR